MIITFDAKWNLWSVALGGAVELIIDADTLFMNYFPGDGTMEELGWAGTGSTVEEAFEFAAGFVA